MTKTKTLVERNSEELARPLKVLVPLIREEIAVGDEAGLGHYRRAGEMLLEAKPQVPHGEWEAWVKRHFDRTTQTARNWMNLAFKSKAGIRFETVSHSRGDLRKPGRPPVWHEPIKRIIDTAAGERFMQRFKEARQETELIHELALKIIDAGYKVLSMKMHPDKGGNPDAMRRLNEARKMLKGAI